MALGIGTVVQARPASSTREASGSAAGRSDRATNFDLIRLVGASVVVLCHSVYVLRGHAWWDLHSQMWLSQLGNDFLNSFFVISGYLVTQSWRQDPHFLRYFTRRMLRLMPALGPLLLITVLAGALLSIYGPLDYLHRGGTWVHLLDFLLFPQVSYLPGVFKNSPTVQVNPQLWTLPFEFTCYIGVAVVAVIGMRLRRRSYRVVAAMLGIAVLGAFATQKLLLGLSSAKIAGINFTVGLDTPHLGRVAGYFIGGALFVYWGRYIPLRALPAAASLVAFILSSQVPWLFPFTVVFFVYAVLYFAMGAPQILRWATRHGDFSYGMYIYSFFIQQMVAAALGWTRSPLVIFVVSWPCALLAAMASWHLVEKRALRLKPRSLRIRRREADVQIAVGTESALVTAESGATA